MEDSNLIAACDRLLSTELEILQMPIEQVRWFMSKPGHRDCFTVARALKAILETRAIPRKGPRMADERVDPVEQIQCWLRQYLEFVKAPELAKQLDPQLLFRIARTMYNQGKELKDVQEILSTLAKEKRKPKSIGWIITVVEGKLGRVA